MFRRPCRFALIVLALACVGEPSSGVAQQLYVMQTGPQCAARGGRIITWTNTAGQGTDVGECYVPPRAGGGAAGSYYGSGGGDSRAAAVALGAGLFIDLMAQVARSSEMTRSATVAPRRQSAPAQTVYTLSPWYKNYLNELATTKSEQSARASDLIAFVNQSKPAPQVCASYPQTEAGLGQCFKDIAGELESKSASCADEECSAVLMRNAASARCTAAYVATSADVAAATAHCARAPADYERLHARMRAEETRLKEAVARLQKEASLKPKIQAIAGDCETSANPTICALLRDARDDYSAGRRTNLPFNCGRAGGSWDGDIVHGRCRLPGDTSPLFDPAREAKVAAGQFDIMLSRAKQHRAAGNEANSRKWAIAAEQEFTTLVSLVSSMPHSEGQRLADRTLRLFWDFVSKPI
jgi:hypothetical protein